MSIFHFPKIVLEKTCFVTEKIFSVTKLFELLKICDDKIFFENMFLQKKTFRDFLVTNNIIKNDN